MSEELRCTISESEYFPCLFDEIQKCRVECDIPLLLIYDYVISNVNSDVERYIVPVKLQVEFYDDGTDAFSAKYNSYVRGNGNFIDLWCAFEGVANRSFWMHGLKYFKIHIVSNLFLQWN